MSLCSAARWNWGTGVKTGLSQIVAEELDFPVTRIRMIMGDTALVPDQGTTTGSKTTQMGGPPLRRAAAEARRRAGGNSPRRNSA